jgi:5,10-methenyltetrahydrofolate synthetase
MTMADQSGDQGIDNTFFHATQRRLKLDAREAMSAIGRAHATELIVAHLAALLAAGPPKAIAFCSPVRGEVDCRPLIERLLASGWRACQPVVVTPAAPMEFRTWTPESLMAADRHGIPIPAAGQLTLPDVVLLPLVAFDEEGYRLGYGGGYFDRTLAALAPRPLTIGVGFELACLDSIRPQAHDVPLDVIVTESGIRRVAPSRA